MTAVGQQDTLKETLSEYQNAMMNMDPKQKAAVQELIKEGQQALHKGDDSKCMEINGKLRAIPLKEKQKITDSSEDDEGGMSETHAEGEASTSDLADLPGIRSAIAGALTPGDTPPEEVEEQEKEDEKKVDDMLDEDEEKGPDEPEKTEDPPPDPDPDPAGPSDDGQTPDPEDPPAPEDPPPEDPPEEETPPVDPEVAAAMSKPPEPEVDPVTGGPPDPPTSDPVEEKGPPPEDINGGDSDGDAQPPPPPPPAVPPPPPVKNLAEAAAMPNYPLMPGDQLHVFRRDLGTAIKKDHKIDGKFPYWYELHWAPKGKPHVVIPWEKYKDFCLEKSSAYKQVDGDSKKKIGTAKSFLNLNKLENPKVPDSSMVALALTKVQDQYFEADSSVMQEVMKDAAANPNGAKSMTPDQKAAAAAQAPTVDAPAPVATQPEDKPSDRRLKDIELDDDINDILMKRGI